MAAFAGPPGVGHFRPDLGVGPATGTHAYGGGGGGMEEAHRAAQGHQQGQSQHGGQFGILAPTTVPGGVEAHQQQQQQQQQQQGAFAAAGGGQDTGERVNGKLGGRIVVGPPDLHAWRERLFNVDEMIVLTHDQFETYFPHVDNVYSHRSTQSYKRKPFVSHYWDCRMKGRPPGTPKSTDPHKKTRRRSARERDLCDVKIRITEYLPSASGGGEFADREAAAAAAAGATVPPGQRFWTIQRVNGNGGNGKGDGVAGPHRHSLERSDAIKKNSVQRWMAQRDREAKKAQKLPLRRASGAALATARKHSKDSDLKLYAACFWYPALLLRSARDTDLTASQPLFAARVDRPRGQGPGLPVLRDGPVPTAGAHAAARGEPAGPGPGRAAGRVGVCGERCHSGIPWHTKDRRLAERLLRIWIAASRCIRPTRGSRQTAASGSTMQVPPRLTSGRLRIVRVADLVYRLTPASSLPSPPSSKPRTPPSRALRQSVC
ncbi:hypothetical protein TOPH_04881 [Tolypocladium ophioglossoides CBS 100239]|uniref:Uncharacterized protein n=1 Tax=Tolypocladium ophioglossoides (strain CBS 100239) TaxID=1163406 RepID=A0A0L0N8J3_TOLOC|nr:hypothetical protein TOPH_04881 [Tolypocladium ophioglossoides CBS 100239]